MAKGNAIAFLTCPRCKRGQEQDFVRLLFIAKEASGIPTRRLYVPTWGILCGSLWYNPAEHVGELVQARTRGAFSQAGVKHKRTLALEIRETLQQKREG